MQAIDEFARPVVGSARSVWQMAVVLFKLRVVSLLLLAAGGGLALGHLATGRGEWGALILLVITGGLAAAGASAINQYLERERDQRMHRTAARPLPAGQIAQPHLILGLGVGMVALATALAAVFNVALAFWVGLGAIIYVVVYTLWLKPRTTLNIVIGGAAGSCVVISGGAAAGAWANLSVWLLAALVFVWTPVHFWALALAYRVDYIRADYPMLPARVPATTAARWIALHTLLTLAAGLALGLWPTLDWFYLVPVTLISLWLAVRTAAVVALPERWPALALFHASNLYLTFILAATMLATLWR